MYREDNKYFRSEFLPLPLSKIIKVKSTSASAVYLSLLFSVIKAISPILFKQAEFLEPEEMSVSDFTELQKNFGSED